ncbi:MAG: FadR/GntR family transcriptional regulator [Lachnospiraceae bacterium]|nr:FadR/GntR family transcriptional regulator [Lachnospiraceae bacterium]
MAKGQTLSTKIVNDLETQIIEGNLKPGDQIPNEQDLMIHYEVSRSTVREAIKSLISKGTLEIQRGKGTYVCRLPGLTSDPLGLNFADIDDLNHYLYETRLIFEPEVSAMSALRASDSEIRTLEKLSADINKLDETLKGADTSADIIQKLHEKDLAFHIMLCRTCHNPVLERLMPIIIQSISFSYDEETFKKRLTKKPRQSTHDKICRAIASHDAEKAKDLMHLHLLNSME